MCGGGAIGPCGPYGLFPSGRKPCRGILICAGDIEPQ